MIRKISVFIGILLFAGFLIIFELFNYNFYLKNYFKKSENILNELNSLKKEEYKLNYLILKSTFYLYENNDPVMDEINKINKMLAKLKNNSFFRDKFPFSYKKFLIYSKFYEMKKNNIYRFFTYNSIIKNATLYLDKILSSSINVFGDNKEFLQKEIWTIGNVLITKNSFDKSFLKNLDMNYFENLHFKQKNKKTMKNVLSENLILFKNTFPKYSLYLTKIQHSKDLKYLNFTIKKYFYERDLNLKKINYIFYIIIFVLLGGIIIVSFLLYLINKEHFILEKSFITDSLTLLGNREKFNMDIKKYKNPTLYLINIDKFKHINDIYGIEIGDKILKKVADILKNNFNCKHKNVYRIGSDDFAILCEGELDYHKIIDFFKSHSILVDGKEFNIRVSIGISKEFPLIETADMALKKVKKDVNLTSFIYNKNCSLMQHYKENLEKSEILRNAIKNNLIVPVFQPVFDNKTLKICKYEVLARIKTDNGLISIYPFLKIAKENKIYKEITKAIFLKAYDILKEKNVEFSLNLSIDDLLESETINLIDKIFKDKDFAKRCTFEFLESEAIEDYGVVKRFIDKMKKIGVKFAVDDFGSGYSNFEHILNLKIDYLKIDGSLIKRIENENTRIIVRTINLFAKKIHILTVAEFVSNEKIFNLVKKLGIHCSQGFYLSKPLEKI